MFLNILIIIIGILINLFGIWQSQIIGWLPSKFRKILFSSVGCLIIITGVFNIVLDQRRTEETRKLKEERLILTDLKIKYEIIGPLTKNTQVGQILGSRLMLKVYSRKDSTNTPFYLYSPTIWNVAALPSNQVMVNIIFSSSPELPLIGKRINSLEKYDAIKFPLGVMARAMNLRKVNQIIEMIQAVYINGIEIRRVELSSGSMHDNPEFEILETTVNEWFSRPFRNVEKEYLKAIKESTEIE